MPVVFRTLARDRIPEITQSEGRRPVTRAPDEASHRQALPAKLIEQAQQASHATANDLPGEPAVLEVLRARTMTTGMAASPRAWRRQAQPTRRLRRKDLPRISRMRQQHR